MFKFFDLYENTATWYIDFAFNKILPGTAEYLKYSRLVDKKKNEDFRAFYIRMLGELQYFMDGEFSDQILRELMVNEVQIDDELAVLRLVISTPTGYSYEVFYDFKDLSGICKPL